MTYIGYARASYTGQSLNLQLNKLEEFGCQAPSGVIFTEEQNALDVEDRQALKACLQRIGSGDILVVTKLNRLTSSSSRIVQICRQIDQRGAGLIAIDQKINTRTLRGKLQLKYHLFRNIL